MAEDRAKLSFDGYQENEPPAVKVTSLQVIDHNKEVKEYFQQQEDGCHVFSVATVKYSAATASALKVTRNFLSPSPGLQVTHRPIIFGRVLPFDAESLQPAQVMIP